MDYYKTYTLLVLETRLSKVMSVVMGRGIAWQDVQPDDSSATSTTITLNGGHGASMREVIKALESLGLELELAKPAASAPAA